MIFLRLTVTCYIHEMNALTKLSLWFNNTKYRISARDLNSSETHNKTNNLLKYGEHALCICLNEMIMMRVLPPYLYLFVCVTLHGHL